MYKKPKLQQKKFISEEGLYNYISTYRDRRHGIAALAYNQSFPRGTDEFENLIKLPILFFND